MDKRVVFAVAGSGKTKLIVDELTIDSKAAIVTYTLRNEENLRSRVIQKFGTIPKGVRIYSYYTFLYSFCFRPIVGINLQDKGINFDMPPTFTARLPRTNLKFYIDNSQRMYSNRLAKFLQQFNYIGDIQERLTKYFDTVFIDEVQDLGGHDFNFILDLVPTNINFLFVGDFFQHTFDTSRDGALNAGLYKDYGKYKERFEKAGIEVDETSLIKSHRCSPTICNFVTEALGIDIQSHQQKETELEHIVEEQKIKEIFDCNLTVKLFYQSSGKFQGYTCNWGASKGEDKYNNVCVVLNKTTFTHFKKGTLLELNPQTRNKLYVACTRSKNNLYLISEASLKKVIA